MKRILPILMLVMMGCQPFAVEDPESCGRILDSWEQVLAPDILSITDIASPNGRNLAVCSVFGQVLMSNDGGETWESALTIEDVKDNVIANPSLTAISLPKPGLIYTAREALYVSEDNGVSWKARRALEEVSGVARGMHFFDEQQGVVATSSGIYRTRNGGESWKVVLKDRSLDRLRFFTRDIGFTWSLDIPTSPIPGNANLEASSRLFRSTNQGKSWQELSNPDIPLIRDLFMLETGQLFVIGLEGELFRSDDGGESWETLDQSLPGVGSLLFADECTGYVSDYEGAIYGTENAGLSWVQLSPAVSRSSPLSRLIESENGVIAVGNQGVILMGK